jgi:hypothetical protein
LGAHLGLRFHDLPYAKIEHMDLRQIYLWLQRFSNVVLCFNLFYRFWTGHDVAGVLQHHRPRTATRRYNKDQPLNRSAAKRRGDWVIYRGSALEASVGGLGFRQQFL